MPPESESYRVRYPLVAMKNGKHGPSRFITIPEGSLIEVKHSQTSFQFVEVHYEGELMTVSNRDLHDKSEKIV